MARIILISFSLLCWYQEAACQQIDWRKTGQASILGLELLSIDGRDQIFTADREGNIRQFSEKGDSLNFYSPVFRTALTKLEAFWTTTLFLFSRDLQGYELLDRFLNPVSSNRFSDGEVGVISQATYGNGNIVWLVNETRFSLIKWDFRRNTILQEQPLSLTVSSPTLQVVGLTERKNLLFLQMAGEGIYIFDNQGNFLKQVADVPDTAVFISDEYLYYISEDMLLKTNYLLGKTISYRLPDTIYKKVALTKNFVIFYGDQGFELYEKPTFL